MVRPLGDTLNFFWYGTALQVYADAGPFVAEIGVWQNKYYDVDPDGLDTALRLLARSENTYLGYHSRLFSAYLGRWSNHWGMPGEPGLLISNNPRSQDQVYLRLGRQRFSVTGLLTELDSITEALIHDVLQRLKGRITIVIVAHRLSTIRNADQVIVLDDGRLVESGPPGELLEREGTFTRLAMSQAEKGKVEINS